MLSRLPALSPKVAAETLRIAAVRPNNTAVLLQLLAHGADPTLPLGIECMPALSKAAEAGCPHNLRVLLDWLAKEGRLEAVWTLRPERGGPAVATGGVWHTPMECACEEVRKSGGVGKPSGQQ